MANNTNTQYKKKPDVVDACSVTLILSALPAEYPQWVVDAFAAGSLAVEGNTLSVVTESGTKAASRGDMLVHASNGWLTPLALADFNALYEAITP